MAKDRRISIEDAEMRHGRKSRSVRVDGYKRHVLHDLDTGLIPAVGITPANVSEARVTKKISADLAPQGVYVTELHIDRGYLSSHFVRERSDELTIYCKAWPGGEAFLEAGIYPGLGSADHPLSRRIGDAFCPWWSCAFSHGMRNERRTTGADFALQTDGTLRCPAGQFLHPHERRREANGSLRVVYGASIRTCRPCPLRE